MSISYKIVLNYIKDLSVEIPDADTLVVSRKNLPNYLLDISISSKPIKKLMSLISLFRSIFSKS